MVSLGGGGGVDEEVLPAQAGVSLAAVRIEDPERGPSARRSEPVARDQRLGLLPDHVPPEADPSPTGQLESESGRLGDRGREAIRVAAAGGLEQDQQDVRAPGERRQAMQPVGGLRSAVGARKAGRQVDEEQIDRAARPASHGLPPPWPRTASRQSPPAAPREAVAPARHRPVPRAPARRPTAARVRPPGLRKGRTPDRAGRSSRRSPG